MYRKIALLLALVLAAAVVDKASALEHGRKVLAAEPSYPDDDTYLYVLPDLPYEYDALEPYIDEETMIIHHDRHHKTYVDNLNKALANYTALQSLDLEDLIEAVGTDAIPESVQTAVRNNAGGHWNHAFFWTILTPNATLEPVGSLADAIDEQFGSFDDFKTEFAAAATTRFGSGFAWLIVSSTTGNLTITSTPNQDNPLNSIVVDEPGTPVLGLDVWEHAYYLKYQNKRPDYISAFWNIVNWEQAEEYYIAATA